MHASCEVAHGRRCSTSTTLITARNSCTAGICAYTLLSPPACGAVAGQCAHQIFVGGAAQQEQLRAQQLQQDTCRPRLLDRLSMRLELMFHLFNPSDATLVHVAASLPSLHIPANLAARAPNAMFQHA